MAVPTLAICSLESAGRKRCESPFLRTLPRRSTYFCSYVIGQNLVATPQQISRELRKCLKFRQSSLLVKKWENRCWGTSSCLCLASSLPSPLQPWLPWDLLRGRARPTGVLWQVIANPDCCFSCAMHCYPLGMYHQFSQAALWSRFYCDPISQSIKSSSEREGKLLMVPQLLTERTGIWTHAVWFQGTCS